jgi:hypothetical protein
VKNGTCVGAIVVYFLAAPIAVCVAGLLVGDRVRQGSSLYAIAGVLCATHLLFVFVELRRDTGQIDNDGTFGAVVAGLVVVPTLTVGLAWLWKRAWPMRETRETD